VTPAEVALLKSLCQGDVVTFMPEDNTAAARAKYDATIESLREMKKASWIELRGSSDQIQVALSFRLLERLAALRRQLAGAHPGGVSRLVAGLRLRHPDQSFPLQPTQPLYLPHPPR
jgi:hypothetical protein